MQVLTLSRSGYFGLAFGLLVLAIPLRRQLLSPRLVVPVAICLVAAVAVASQSHYVRTVYKSRVTVSDRSAQVHYQIFALVPPVLSLHPWLGLGLNTFSVYYEFETGRTDWGPHSFYVALIAETGLIGTAAFGLFLLWLFLRLAVLRRCAEALRARRRPPRVAGRTPVLRADCGPGGDARRERLLPDDAVLLLLRAGAGDRGRAAAVPPERRPAVTVDVSVIVVAYEARDLLRRCLEALDADADGADVEPRADRGRQRVGRRHGRLAAGRARRT